MNTFGHWCLGSVAGGTGPRGNMTVYWLGVFFGSGGRTMEEKRATGRAGGEGDGK